MKLVIGNKNYSSWSLRPWLLLKHHGIPFAEYRISLFTEGFKAAISDFSGAGKVPVLIDDDLVIWDSLAICEYISEAYLDGKGYPENIQARAVARSAVSEMHSGFFNIRERMPMNCRAEGRQVQMNDSLQEEIERIDMMWNELRSQYSHQGPWLFGNFTIADCMYAPVALRCKTYGIKLSGAAEIYKNHVLDDTDIKLWVEAAKEESEIISAAEAG